MWVLVILFFLLFCNFKISQDTKSNKHEEEQQDSYFLFQDDYLEVC